jgi:hypothetical protein
MAIKKIGFRIIVETLTKGQFKQARDRPDINRA